MGISVKLPVIAQSIEGGFGQRYVSVFSAFTPMDMNAHALCVNVGYLKEEGFMEPQAACVNGGQVGFILCGIDRVDDAPDLVET